MLVFNMNPLHKTRVPSADHRVRFQASFNGETSLEASYGFDLDCEISPEPDIAAVTKYIACLSTCCTETLANNVNLEKKLDLNKSDGLFYWGPLDTILAISFVTDMRSCNLVRICKTECRASVINVSLSPYRGVSLTF